MVEQRKHPPNLLTKCLPNLHNPLNINTLKRNADLRVGACGTADREVGVTSNQFFKKLNHPKKITRL